MNDKIGALVIDLQGLQLSSEESELLNHPLVGGIILFSRNYDNPQQLQSLCQAIRLARKQPIIIMVDQEGGRVQRFKNQFFPLPSLSFFGEWYDQNPTLALELSRTGAWVMANEIISAGIDISLAPVVDLNKLNNTAIGTRAFHSDTEAVYRLANAYVRGMHEAGMTATIKHFPGHGSVQVDSHLELPVDQRSLDIIMKDDIKPFQQLIHDGIHAVMAAHIKFPCVDEKQVSFSKVWLQDILRKQLGFQGTIMSDDLNMQGANISADYSDRVTAAREAGCDFVLLCNNRDGVIQTLDGVAHKNHQLSSDKWQPLQGTFSNNDSNEERKQAAQQFLQAHINLIQQPLTKVK